jgi:membrane-associated phospholipid phosphatase
MFAVLGLALALVSTTFIPALAWAAVYGFLVSLAPILFIVYLLRSGRIGDLHMSLPRERHLPYLVSIICSALYLGLHALFDGPAPLRCLGIFNVVELAALAVINTFWLISIHATGIMATTVIAGLAFGPLAGWLLLPLLVMVCWARLYLKRHTLGQVLAGLALGAVSVFSLTPTGCFL